MELKEIRLKIQSVTNIWKLTSALETLSALKMKKSQKIALESRPFAQKVGHLIRCLEPVLKDKVVLRKRPLKNALAVVIASDRGVLRIVQSERFKIRRRAIKGAGK